MGSWQGHQHSVLAQNRQFANNAHACATDHEIGSRQQVSHAFRNKSVGVILRPVPTGGVAASGEVNHLKLAEPQLAQFGNNLIQTLCPLPSAGEEQHRPLGIETKLSVRSFCVSIQNF